MPQKILAFAPRDAHEAAGVFRACSEAAGAGRKIKAAIVESPFRPAEGLAPELRGALEGSPGGSAATSEIESLGASDEALVLLSHVSMHEIHEISSKDFLAVIDGGLTFGAFHDAVHGAGLYFPHEPDPLTREATVAEIIMDGATFSTERRYGSLREYVLALELATPAGEIIRAGSRSVKDVTGYDIAGFLMGGGGRCGMIVKATLRLLPAPGTRLSFICAGSREDLEQLAGEIHGRLNPASLRIFSDSTAAPDRLQLIGELQSARGGRGEQLLNDVSMLAPKTVFVSKLGAAAHEEHGPLQAFGPGGFKEGERLIHVSSPVELPSPPSSRFLRVADLFPMRFHYYYVPDDSESAVQAAARPGSRIETIEMRGGRLFRRCLHREQAAEELARVVRRAFDPQAIMLP